MDISSTARLAQQPAGVAAKSQEKAEVMAEMERLFIKEMIKYAMPKSDNGYFGGGIGEDQMRSFLEDEWAGSIANSMAGKVLRD